MNDSTRRPTPPTTARPSPNTAGLVLFAALVLLLASLQLLPIALENVGSPVPGWLEALLVVIGGGLSPLWAMLIAGTVTLGWSGACRLLRTGVRPGAPVPLYLLAAVLPASAFGVAAILTGSRPAPLEVDLIGLVAQIVLVAPIFALAENLGWRAWLQNGLQNSVPPVHAGLAVGLLWGVWHLPRFVPATQSPQVGLPILGFLTVITVFSVLLAGLFNASRGSVLPVVVAHVSFNIGAQLAMPADPSLAMPLMLTAAALFAGASVVAMPRLRRIARN